jgi:hypothetical protein
MQEKHRIAAGSRIENELNPKNFPEIADNQYKSTPFESPKKCLSTKVIVTKSWLRIID